MPSFRKIMPKSSNYVSALSKRKLGTKPKSRNSVLTLRRLPLGMRSRSNNCVIASYKTSPGTKTKSNNCVTALYKTSPGTRTKSSNCIIVLTDRLRKQLWDTRRLSHLLDDVDNAAARLRSSRRWKLANPGSAIQAKLFPGKVSLGYGHLEKIVTAYSRWRASHPEIAK